ncbi:MAG: cobalt ECF transporter T component CbiQ [Candidatus Hydrothermarchaeales archaeon]
MQIDALSNTEEKALFKLDARVKVVIAVIGIFTSVLLKSWSITFLITAACLFLALSSKIPMKMYLERMAFPLVFGAFIAVVQPFTYGTKTQYVLNIGILSLPVYNEGISFGMLVFHRVLAAASLLNLLTLVTPIVSILDSLSWLKVPKLMIDLTALIMRYIFVLAEESRKISASMVSRLGFSKHLSYKERIKNYGILGGVLILKSSKRAENSYLAMRSRGYSVDSKFYSSINGKLPKRDLAIGTASAIFFLFLFISDKLGWYV